MSPTKKIRVVVNGYGVIGKRVADAVARQDDMELAGVADISVDWRPRMAMQKGFRLYGATNEHAEAMRKAGLDVAGDLDDLPRPTQRWASACSPKRWGHEITRVLRADLGLEAPPRRAQTWLCDR